MPRFEPLPCTGCHERVHELPLALYTNLRTHKYMLFRKIRFDIDEEFNSPLLSRSEYVRLSGFYVIVRKEFDEDPGSLRVFFYLRAPVCPTSVEYLRLFMYINNGSKCCAKSLRNDCKWCIKI